MNIPRMKKVPTDTLEQTVKSMRLLKRESGYYIEIRFNDNTGHSLNIRKGDTKSILSNCLKELSKVVLK